MSEKEQELEEMKKLREREMSGDSIDASLAVGEIKRRQYADMKKEFESLSPLKQAWYKATKKAVKTDDGYEWMVKRGFNKTNFGGSSVHEQKRFIDGKYMTIDDLEKAVEREKQIDRDRKNLYEDLKQKFFKENPGKRHLSEEDSLRIYAQVEDYINRMYPDYEEKENGRSFR